MDADSRKRNFDSMMYSYQAAAPAKKPSVLQGPCFLKFLVPNATAGRIIGKAGSELAALERNTGCQMRLSANNSFFPQTRDRTALLSGTQEQICGAVEILVDKLRDECTDPTNGNVFFQCVVPKTAEAYALSSDLSGLGVDLYPTGYYSDAAQKEQVIKVSASYLSLKPAIKILTKSIQTDPSLMNHQLLDYGATFGPGAAPIVPGASGAGASAASSILGGSFGYSIAPQGGPSAPILIDGQMLFHPGGAAMGNTTPGLMEQSCDIVMEIADMYVGPVIGRGGTILSDIMAHTRTRIHISDRVEGGSASTMREVKIAGTVHDVQCAHILILQRIWDTQNGSVRSAPPNPASQASSSNFSSAFPPPSSYAQAGAAAATGYVYGYAPAAYVQQQQGGGGGGDYNPYAGYYGGK